MARGIGKEGGIIGVTAAAVVSLAVAGTLIFSG